MSDTRQYTATEINDKIKRYSIQATAFFISAIVFLVIFIFTLVLVSSDDSPATVSSVSRVISCWSFFPIGMLLLLEYRKTERKVFKWKYRTQIYQPDMSNIS